MSPNKERFQPPKLWKAIGTGIGTLTPTMPIWMRLEIARDVAVAGEDRDPVAVFVVVDELGRMIEIGAAHAREHRPEDLLPVDPHLRLDLVEQAAVEEKAVLVTLQFETAAVDDELSPFPDAEIDIGAHAVEMLAGDERPSAPERRMSSPAQGFGYAVMNLGLGSAGSMIHTEMVQGFRPSGVTSEQRTSNF